MAALPSSPAAERNKEPILGVLRRVLPASGLVLEVASGTGQHAVHFAAALPALEWQPTEADPDLLAVIAARLEAAALPNTRAPVRLDVLNAPWPIGRAAAVFCANMIHIAPRAAASALLRGAAGVLPAGAPLVLYGPYSIGGQHTAPSNAAFDASLKARDPDWGVRDLEEIVREAGESGLRFVESVEMPANNLVVVLRRA